MRDQPIPNVTRGDVERVVRRDFPAEDWAEVQSTLDQYDTSGPPIARVQLAVLKLADGDLALVRRSIEDAKMDYRDVLAAAEYPDYMRRVPGPGQPPDVDRIIDADWEQYQAWVTR
jgi:hypothetical protein